MRPPAVNRAAGWMCVLLLGASLLTAESEIDAARSLAASGRLPEALGEVERVLEDDPGSLEARLLHGTLLARLGRLDEAEARFAELAAEWPGVREPRVNLASVRALRGDLDGAAQLLRAALVEDPVLGAAYRNLGLVERHAAARAYDRALGQRSGPFPGERLEMLDSWPAGLGEPAGSLEAVAPPFDVGEVVARVEAWAAAWSARRVDDFVASYADDFEPPGGGALTRWAEARLGGPQAPRVASIGARGLANGRAQARAVLAWGEEGAERRAVAVLEMVREEGGWRIASEGLEAE